MTIASQTPGMRVTTEGSASPVGASSTDQTELYPVPVAMRGTYEAHQDAELEVLGLSAEARARRHRDFSTLVADTGVDPYTVGTVLYGALTSADVAAARGEATPDLQGLNEAGRRALADAYGRQEAERLLGLVGAFAGEHPTLAAVLQTRGVGSRTDVVTALVEHVRRVNYRPRTR